MDYGHLVWRRYSSAGSNLTAVFLLEKQDASSWPAGPPTSGAIADVEVPEERLLSIPAEPDDRDEWMMGGVVEVDAER